MGMPEHKYFKKDRLPIHDAQWSMAVGFASATKNTTQKLQNGMTTICRGSVKHLQKTVANEWICQNNNFENNGNRNCKTAITAITAPMKNQTLPESTDMVGNNCPILNAHIIKSKTGIVSTSLLSWDVILSNEVSFSNNPFLSGTKIARTHLGNCATLAPRCHHVVRNNRIPMCSNWGGMLKAINGRQKQQNPPRNSSCEVLMLEQQMSPHFAKTTP